jgi:hypothetical protein
MATRKGSYDREVRAQLATVDCLTVEDCAAKAQASLRDGNLSVALDHLAQAKKAVARAEKMIKEGR